MQLGSVYLIVKDFQKSIEFYEVLLEQKVRARNMDRFAQFEFGGHNISIMSAVFDQEHPTLTEHRGEYIKEFDDLPSIANAVNTHKCVFNFWTHDLQKEYERITGAGISNRVSQIKYVNNVMPYYYFQLEDPDGNVIEVTGEYKETQPILDRCNWCKDHGIMQQYHDTEWGIPIHDDKKQFEFLMMEVMQCGLNWTMMLKKRETFRACFDNFDYTKIAHYDEAKIVQILDTPDMIHSRRKIEAVIHNAKQFLRIIDEFGSFSEYLWSYTDHKTVLYRGHEYGNLPAKNELSDRISMDLKKRGFQYLGSITVYSHLQACGIINDHNISCFLYHQIVTNDPCILKDRCGEE